MEINELLKLIIVLLSLLCPVITYPDFTSHRSPEKMRTSHMSNTSARNNVNETIVRLNARSSVSNNNNQKNQESDNPIIYPDDSNVKRHSDDSNVKRQTKCFHGLCENVADYPDDLINNLLQRSQFANSYFESLNKFRPVEIGTRFKADENSLCETTSTIRFPQKANNLNKVERMIVNTEERQQKVLIHTCVNENMPCKLSKNFPNDYNISCVQKYMQIPLMVVENNNNFTFDVFEVPSCCVCSVEKKKMN